VNDLPAGTYVCVLTNAGRYSEFRVNAPVGPFPGTLRIHYITWEYIFRIIKPPVMIPILPTPTP